MKTHRYITRILSLAVAFVSASVLLASAASAAPGDLDSSWSGDGKQTLANGARRAIATVLQADGKLVVAGEGYFSDGSPSLSGTYVARYDAAGNLDPAFGTGGVATLNGMKGSETIRDVAIDGSGRVVVVGFGEGTYPDISDVYVMRFTAAGKPDTSFSGDGLVVIDRTNHDRVGGVAFSGNRILLGATADLGGNWANQWTVVALNNAGAPDTSFSGDGFAEIPVALVGYYDDIRDVSVQSDGKILLGGSHYAEFASARLTGAGALDPTWDGDGVARTTVEGGGGAFRMLVQKDKKVVLVGYARLVGRTDDDFAAVRWNTNGTLDASFSGDGKMTLDIGNKTPDRALTGGLAADEKIVLGGHSSPSGMDMAVARINWNGTPDTSFSGDGRTVTSSLAANNEQIESLVVGANDRVVAAGWNLNGWVTLGYTGRGIPTLAVADATVAEPDTATANATFTVRLSAASASAVTVRYATANTTANATDFTAKSGTVTFAPGQTTKTIVVPVIGDTVVEPNETFKVNLTKPTNASIADAGAVGTITNDD
jgi:uncharacterized delta-60 repeat protein